MPAGEHTRPTTDRVREAVFSAIGSWSGTGATMDGLRLLDLYAGSGAMGLEAASRGAAQVLCVEADRKTAGIITSNARRLGLDVTVAVGRVGDIVRQPPRFTADVAWLDPPYDVGTESVQAECAQLVAGGWLADDGLVIVERSSRSVPLTWPSGWDAWSRDYGETTVHYAQRRGD